MTRPSTERRTDAPDAPSSEPAPGRDDASGLGSVPPSGSSPAEGQGAAPWTSRVLIASCAIGIAFLMLQILTFGYGRDQGIYAVVGEAITDGRMPYRDAWDFKPPGIFLVYALARSLFGGSQAGVRALEVVGLGFMVAGMIRLAETWWGDARIGWIAGALAALVHAQLDFWHTAQPESFGGMLTIAGLVAASSDRTRAPRASARWDRGPILAGVLFGAAGLLKPPLAGGGVIVALALAWDAWSSFAPGAAGGIARMRAALRPIGLVLLGGVAPVLLCALWFAGKGALRDLWDVLFIFTPHYTALSWQGESVAGMAYWGFTEWLCAYASPLTVGFLLLLAFGVTPRERPAVIVLGGIIAIHVVGVVLQGKFFPYHYGATWPPTAMLAALGLHKAWLRLSRRGAVGIGLFYAGFAAVALCRSATKDTPDSFRERTEKRIRLLPTWGRDQDAIDALASVADVNAAANRRVADLLRARVPEGRPVLVWGFEPVIYDLANRRPATRFIYDVPQRVAWAKERMREVMMRDLGATPPAAIVVEHRDVFPMVTGDAIDSADVLADFPALRDLVAARYGEAARIEDLDVYLERPPAP